MAWWITLLGCTTDPTVGTLTDNVGSAFRPCQESEIRFLATKHNAQLAFEPCGRNSFGTFAWSPDGRSLYFQLNQTAYVMDAVAENKATAPLPVPAPIGAAAWVSATRLVVPVGPEATDGPNRLAVFDNDSRSVYYREVPHAHIRSVHRRKDRSHVLVVVAEAAEGPARALSMELGDGALQPTPDALGSFDTLTVSVTTSQDVPDAPLPDEVVVVGRGDQVELRDLSNGELLATYEGATRGSLHRGGRWLALEHPGEEVSIFYQRAWDEMTDAQRRREHQRAERLAANLPDSYPTRVRPPTVDFIDRRDDARWALTSMHGDQFMWYEAADYWGSMMFWGFESKQFKRNVLLAQLGNRLRATELGREIMGVVPLNDAAKSRYSEPKAEPEPSDE